MSKSTPHIISIWLVDPVGGTFVDWPANAVDADFGPEPLIARVFGSSAVRSLALPTLNTLTDPNATFWVPHDQIDTLIAECDSVIRDCNLIAAETDVLPDDLTLYITRLRSAANHAMSIPDAGVCIT